MLNVAPGVYLGGGRTRRWTASTSEPPVRCIIIQRRSFQGFSSDALEHQPSVGGLGFSRTPRGLSASLPIPAFGKRLHGGLTGFLIAMGRCAVFVLAVGQSPKPGRRRRRRGHADMPGRTWSPSKTSYWSPDDPMRLSSRSVMADIASPYKKKAPEVSLHREP